MKLPNLLVRRAEDQNLTGGLRANGCVGISGRDLFPQVGIFPDRGPIAFKPDDHGNTRDQHDYGGADLEHCWVHADRRGDIAANYAY